MLSLDVLYLLLYGGDFIFGTTTNFACFLFLVFFMYNVWDDCVDVTLAEDDKKSATQKLFLSLEVLLSGNQMSSSAKGLTSSFIDPQC